MNLQDYLTEITSPEPPLLAKLRQETLQTREQAHMLTGQVEGTLLQFLIQLMGAKTCLEIGTFTGYSALYMAAALPVDGQLITCEIQENNARTAQKYFDLSPHGHKIQLLLGDALSLVPTLEPSFDFIFLDANQAKYPDYYELLLAKLRCGGLLVVDNALWKGEVISPDSKYAKAIHTFNLKSRHDPNVETVLLSLRDGILLIRKITE